MNDLGHFLLLSIRGVTDQTLRNDNAKLTWATILEKDSKNHQIISQSCMPWESLSNWGFIFFKIMHYVPYIKITVHWSKVCTKTLTGVVWNWNLNPTFSNLRVPAKSTYIPISRDPLGLQMVLPLISCVAKSNKHAGILWDDAWTKLFHMFLFQDLDEIRLHSHSRI